MEGPQGIEGNDKELEEHKEEISDRKCGMSWIKFVRTKIAVLDIGLTNVDICSDLRTAIEHFKSCNYYWGCATLLFIMLPTLPTFIDFMKDKIEEIKAGELRWLGNTELIKTKSPFLGLIYLLLVFFLYFGGGIALVTVYQVGYTLYCMGKMFLDPPGKDGMIVTKYQEKALMGKSLECLLEAAPQCLLQFWIVWSFGFTSWTQYVSIVTSVISLAWGSTNTLLLLLHGNKKIPSLNDSLIGLIAILPHSVMIVTSYSLLFTYGLNLSILLFSILLTIFFILSALFSNDFYTFVFTIFSSFFSPVLFLRSFESKEKPDLDLARDANRNDGHKMDNIYRYRFTSQQFYGLNKLITSVFLLCCMAPLVFLVNSNANVPDYYGVPPFQFKIYHERDNVTTFFDCKNYCQAKTFNETCESSCSNEKPTDPGSILLCSQICENVHTSEDYSKLKKDTCRSLQLTSTTLINVLFSFLAIFAITSLVDSVVILSPWFDWSPSYMLLFKISSEKDRHTIRAVDMELNPLAENETSQSKKIPRKKDYKRSYAQNFIYRVTRIVIGIFGYLWVKYQVIQRSVTDYHNGDLWWCFLGLACIVLPTIPAVLKYLQRKIEDINSRRDASKVKPFFQLLLFTLFYIFGGFLLFTLYRICFKLFCTMQNIRDPIGKENEMKYRRKEVELNLTQALLESAPDGLLQLYRILQFTGEVSAMKNLLFDVLLRALSVVNVLTYGHMIARDGSVLVNVWKLLIAYLAVLPEVFFRWLTYAVILAAYTWLGHTMVLLFVIIYFFQASVTGKDFEAAVYSVFSSFTSPFMFVKDFDVEHRRKGVQTKELKTFYCMNKKTTSFILLVFIIAGYNIEDHRLVSGDGKTNITICHWMYNLTDSRTHSTGENDAIVDKTCSLHFLFPILVVCAVISLVDGILTLRYGKSLSSFLLFPKQKYKNIGVKHLIIDASDLLNALENYTTTHEISYFIENGISTIPVENFGDDKISLLREKTDEWNQKQSDNKLFIQAETEDMCKGRIFSFPHIVPSNSWNDRASYEEKGPITGLRIWRTNLDIFRIQFKYGQIWEEERGHKFDTYSCCHCIKLDLEMFEIGLDDGELINHVEAKTNGLNGGLHRLRIGTTKDRSFDSRRSKFSITNFTIAWDEESWPHNREKCDSLVLAYCSGRDEAGHGPGRILNFHWVPRQE